MNENKQYTAELKVDYEKISKELEKKVGERDVEISTLMEHLEYLQGKTNDTKVGIDFEKEYDKLRNENFVLQNELERVTKALINLAGNL